MWDRVSSTSVLRRVGNLRRCGAIVAFLRARNSWLGRVSTLRGARRIVPALGARGNTLSVGHLGGARCVVVCLTTRSGTLRISRRLTSTVGGNRGSILLTLSARGRGRRRGARGFALGAGR